MSDDRLRELGKQLPWDRPDAERREAVRSGLLVAATQGDPTTSRKRWLLAGGGFVAGALAAAAIALLVIAPRDPQVQPREAHARIDAPSTANIEHTVSTTATGTDEVVRVRTGTVKVAVPAMKKGDRVRMQTADAEVEGTGTYEAVVVGDRLERVTVNEGSANVRVRVDGKQQQVFLAAGQTWRAAIVTAQMDLPSAPAATTDEIATAKDQTAKANEAKDETANDEAPVAKVGATAATNDPAARKTAASDGAASVARDRAAAATAAAGTDATSDDVKAPAAAKSAATSSGATTGSTATSSGATTGSTATSTGASDATGSTTTDAARMPAVTTLTPTTPSTAKRTVSQTEQHFQAGWALLRAGKAREAAVELGAAADAGGDDPLAADARYFQAVALVRAGEGVEAERVLVAFLDKARTSLRRGRAAILLGKLIRDRGDTKSARAWFESALGDSDPAIAAAAKAHLDALSPRR